MATVEQTYASIPVAATTVPAERQAPEDHHKIIGRLGSWQLLRKIGEGGLTRVYLAQPAGADGPGAASYCVKVLKNEWWRDASAIAQQRREAWIGSQVSHANVVPVLSAEVTGPPFSIVMPLLEGNDLARMIEDGFEPVIPVALWIVRQVAEGLGAVLDRTGMIHSDVKPSNIIVAPTGHATLIDFGFAHSTTEPCSWADRPLMGTLNYIAPEMVTSTLSADHRTDIYSLGVTLFELLTGQLPFESNNPGELAELHRQAKPPRVDHIRSLVPEGVSRLVERMLAKNPIRRPTTYTELVDELARLEIDCFEMR